MNTPQFYDCVIQKKVTLARYQKKYTTLKQKNKRKLKKKKLTRGAAYQTGYGRDTAK